MSGSGGGPNAASAQQFVRAEMLPSGYLVRPCEGGGSIVHIVDHLDLEVWFPLCIFILILMQLVSMLSINDCIGFHLSGMECSGSASTSV